MTYLFINENKECKKHQKTNKKTTRGSGLV
jgi:hypothetical protein